MPQEKKKTKKGNRTSAEHRLVSEMVRQNQLASTDPLGSYTGRPVDPYERPVQDADDL